MQCKLDWLSFTIPIRMGGGADDDLSQRHIMQTFHTFTNQSFLAVVTLSDWIPEKGHGVFTDALVCPLTGLRIEYNPKIPYMLIQMSGGTCDSVKEQIPYASLAEACGGRATRIDLAVDIETDVSPQSFTAQRSSDRFKTSGFYTSETGETCYVGSRSGERMARVYRYFSPHPRSHLLRAEIEYKGQAAKGLVETMLSVPLNKLTLSAHLPFGWQHPVWQPDEAEISKIPARPYDKSNDGRWTWLMTVCWPALKKAHEEGMIDIERLIEEWKPKA